MIARSCLANNGTKIPLNMSNTARYFENKPEEDFYF